MKMTKTRKNLQDKLRKRFGWKTFWEKHGDITTLCKENIAKFKCNDGRVGSIKLEIEMLPHKLWNELTGNGDPHGITISYWKVDGHGSKPWAITKITFEELETIYKIVKEKRYEIISEKTGSGNVMEDENAED